MSNADDLVERYATRINRMNEVLRKACETGNPIFETLAEAWLDVLNVIIDQQTENRKFLGRMFDLYATDSQSPTEPGIQTVQGGVDGIADDQSK